MRNCEIVPGDTVVLSATPIPGNEELVNRIIDDLFRLGADVIYSDLCDVHVSGHGSREDLKLMLVADPAQVLHADARRISPSGAAQPAGARDGHPRQTTS